VGRNHAIGLPTLAELLFRFLTERLVWIGRGGAGAWNDYRHGGRRDGPEFLRAFVTEKELQRKTDTARIRGTATSDQAPRQRIRATRGMTIEQQVNEP